MALLALIFCMMNSIIRSYIGVKLEMKKKKEK